MKEKLSLCDYCLVLDCCVAGNSVWKLRKVFKNREENKRN